MKDQQKCEYCGAYLHVEPFYKLKRKEGILEVRMCQKCHARHSRWIKSDII